MARGGQQEIHFRTWGGKRKGAGRKPGGRRAGVAHRRRPELAARHPVLITMRVVPEVGRLRKADGYWAVRQAMATSIMRRLGAFRICHVSIQGNHLHLIVEATDQQALARGMQGFTIACAKYLNRKLGRRGRVFADRYHAETLDGPRRVRHALRYVLNNWRKHREDAHPGTRLDPYSSAAAFGGWSDGAPMQRLGKDAELLPVWFPQTWLLREGWRRAGPISPWDRPGPAQQA